jgi:hypothetical protein
MTTVNSRGSNGSGSVVGDSDGDVSVDWLDCPGSVVASTPPASSTPSPLVQLATSTAAASAIAARVIIQRIRILRVPRSTRRVSRSSMPSATLSAA